MLDCGLTSISHRFFFSHTAYSPNWETGTGSEKNQQPLMFTGPSVVLGWVAQKRQ